MAPGADGLGVAGRGKRGRLSPRIGRTREQRLPVAVRALGEPHVASRTCDVAAAGVAGLEVPATASRQT